MLEGSGFLWKISSPAPVSKCEKLQEVQAVILKVLNLGAGERDGTQKKFTEKQRYLCKLEFFIVFWFGFTAFPGKRIRMKTI